MPHAAGESSGNMSSSRNVPEIAESDAELSAFDEVDLQELSAFGEDVSKVRARATSRKEKPRASAFEKIVNLLNVRDRSEHGLRERLQRDGYTIEETDEAIARAKEYGFVNDARYAEVLVRSRIAQGKGSAGIERELKAEGIDVYIVSGWPEEFIPDGNEEIDRAIALLERKPPRSKNLRDGAYRKLIGKGYSSSVASAATRRSIEKGEGF